MSRRIAAVVLAVLGLGSAGIVGVQLAGAQPAQEAAAAVRFATLEVYVESAEPLAAWQFELTESTGAMAVVGVENGDSAAYPEAPHYDRAVMERASADRIIVADYSLAARDELPSGRTRVATVHVRLTGTRAPDFELQLTAAGNAEGERITAAAIYELQEGRAP